MTKLFSELRKQLNEQKIERQKETLLYEEYSMIELLESRIDFLNQQYASGIDTSHDPEARHTKPEKIIGHFQKNADPTPGSIHTQKILNWYTKGPVENRIKQSDAKDIHKTLSTFEAVKNRLPNKDLNSYKTLTDVKDAIAPHKNYAKEIATSQKPLNTSDDLGESLGLTKIYDKDGVRGYHVPTKESSKRAFSPTGKLCKTSWCTAANTEAYNMFDSYHGAGKLHTLVLPNGKGAINIHHERNEIRNEANRSFGPSRYGEYEKNIREFVNQTDPKKHGKRSNISISHGLYDASSNKEDSDKINLAHDYFEEKVLEHRMREPNHSVEESRKMVLSGLNANFGSTVHTEANQAAKRVQLNDDLFGKIHKMGMLFEAAQNPSIKSHHIDSIIEEKREGYNNVLSSNPNIEKHHQEKLFETGVRGVHSNLSMNTSLHQDVADKLIEHHKNDLGVITPVLHNEGIQIKPHHQELFMNHENYNRSGGLDDSIRALAARPEITKDIQEKIRHLTTNSISFTSSLENLVSNPSYEPKIEHTKDWLNSKNGMRFASHVLQNDPEGKFDKEHVETIIDKMVEKKNSFENSSRSTLSDRFRNPHVSEEHLHKLAVAGYNPSLASDKLSKETISKIIENDPKMENMTGNHKVGLLNQRKFDENHLVEFIKKGNISSDIIQHPKITYKTLDSAVNSADLNTKKSILGSPAAQKHHFDSALNDVRLHSFLSVSDRTPPSILAKLADSKYPHIRENVMNNKNTEKSVKERLKSS